MNSIAVLQKNYVLVLIAIIIALVLSAVMNAASDKKEGGNKHYIQAAVVATAVSVLIIWVHTLVPEIEEISVAPPPF
jgi:hypothetical protein